MRTISLGELRQFIEEATTKNEFEPKFGNGVQKKNKEINGKAINDISKEVKSYDGGLNNKTNQKSNGGLNDEENLAMSDLEYDSINEPFKEKVKAQMAGYTSVSDKKNHPNEFEGNAVFDKQSKNWDTAKKHAKKVNDDRVKMHMAGLTGRTQQKSEVESCHENVFESKKIKRLTFNKTEFLTENHMISKIPDEYKKEGSRFIMKDKKSNEYIVEWADNKPNVTKKVNINEVQQEKDRIKHLWDYKSSEYNNTTTCNSRLNEDNSFENMLNRARRLVNNPSLKEGA